MWHMRILRRLAAALEHAMTYLGAGLTGLSPVIPPREEPRPGPSLAPPALPLGHPERLPADATPTPAEAALWAELAGIDWRVQR